MSLGLLLLQLILNKQAQERAAGGSCPRSSDFAHHVCESKLVARVTLNHTTELPDRLILCFVLRVGSERTVEA
jgi:hypothetical protein